MALRNFFRNYPFSVGLATTVVFGGLGAAVMGNSPKVAEIADELDSQGKPKRIELAKWESTYTDMANKYDKTDMPDAKQQAEGFREKAKQAERELEQLSAKAKTSK